MRSMIRLDTATGLSLEGGSCPVFSSFPLPVQQAAKEGGASAGGRFCRESYGPDSGE